MKDEDLKAKKGCVIARIVSSYPTRIEMERSEVMQHYGFLRKPVKAEMHRLFESRPIA